MIAIIMGLMLVEPIGWGEWTGRMSFGTCVAEPGGVFGNNPFSLRIEGSLSGLCPRPGAWDVGLLVLLLSI